MILPKLFKKTSTGKIQVWEIKTDENNLFSRSGQIDGKFIDSHDIIKSGKNIGRSNETTIEQQPKGKQ